MEKKLQKRHSDIEILDKYIKDIKIYLREFPEASFNEMIANLGLDDNDLLRVAYNIVIDD